MDEEEKMEEDEDDDDDDDDDEDEVEPEKPQSNTKSKGRRKPRSVLTGRGVTLGMLLDDGVMEPGEKCLSIDYLVSFRQHAWLLLIFSEIITWREKLSDSDWLLSRCQACFVKGTIVSKISKVYLDIFEAPEVLAMSRLWVTAMITWYKRAS